MTYFSIAELCQSDTAIRYHINNQPGLNEMSNMAALINEVLDPLRVAYGAPIYVTSGYRCPELNKRVGGAKTSQHQVGLAADISVKKGDGSYATRQANKKLIKLIKKLNLPVDQVIAEYDYKVVHVSYNFENGRKQYLATNDLKTYTRLNTDRL